MPALKHFVISPHVNNGSFPEILSFSSSLIGLCATPAAVGLADATAFDDGCALGYETGEETELVTTSAVGIGIG